MSDNIFESLKARKNKLRHFIEEASSFGWIDNIRKEEMLKKIESDKLTMGVIGQMKCGKSTFLNSFVFEDTVLPSATTPMTAALSVITYGEKERIVAEFYTPDEWAEQKMQASRSIEEAEGNATEESKIKAAKELVSKADKLGSSLNSLLGKTQEDEFANLEEYVGADGKYISITKAVTIYYPKEYLKGVEIVDTPGFNDPIVSREERTKDFLKRADVVLMMLYAGRPFDSTDKGIIFENVRHCGIGKILIGINKYDIPFCNEHNPESEDQIREYVCSEIRKACMEEHDDVLTDILSETTHIPLSAEMALLSELLMSKIMGTEALSFAWNRHSKNFGISSQPEFRKLSHLNDLSAAVKQLIAKDKEKVLFSKPINAIMAIGSKKISDIANSIQNAKRQIELDKMPDSEIDEIESNLKKAQRKLDRKIEGLGKDIDTDLRNIIRKGKNLLEDDVDDACNRMRKIVEDEWKRLTNYDTKIRPKLDAEKARLETRTLKRSVESLANNAERAINACVQEFFSDAEDILMKNLPDFDSKRFIKDVEDQIQVNVEEKSLFTFSPEENEEDWIDIIGDILNGASYGLLGKVSRAVSYNDQKTEVLDQLTALSSEFNPTPYLEVVLRSKDVIISTVQNAFFNELLVPLQEQIEDVRTNKANKEARIKANEELLVKLKNDKKELEEQTATLEKLKTEIL